MSTTDRTAGTSTRTGDTAHRATAAAPTSADVIDGTRPVQTARLAGPSTKWPAMLDTATVMNPTPMVLTTTPTMPATTSSSTWTARPSPATAPYRPAAISVSVHVCVTLRAVL